MSPIGSAIRMTIDTLDEIISIRSVNFILYKLIKAERSKGGNCEKNNFRV